MEIIETYEEKTVVTVVEFIFNIEGVEIKKQFTIPHFMPESQDDITLGIENRFISEERELIEQLKNA